MNSLLKTPPKFETDQTEIKNVIKGSKSIIKEQTNNVSKRATNVKQIATSINVNLQNIIEWEGKLRKWAQDLLEKREIINKNKEDFNENQQKKLKIIEDQIAAEESKVKEIEDKCSSLSFRINQIIDSEKAKEEKDFEKKQEEEKELDNKLQNNVDVINEIEIQQINAKQQSSDSENLIQKTKEEIREIEDSALSLEREIRLQGIEWSKKQVELKKYSAIMQNIEQQIEFANQKKAESYGKLSSDLTLKENKKQAEFSNKKQLMSLIGQKKSGIIGEIEKIKETESEKNIIRSKILQKKAEIAETQKKLNLTLTEKKTVDSDRKKFIDNFLQIRSIKVDTIGKLKGKVFETKDAQSLTQRNIDALINKEKVLQQKIRSADIKIECARADNDLLFTHDTHLQRLEYFEDEKQKKAAEKIVSLNDVYESIKRRINGAELEETRLNNVYVAILDRNNSRNKFSTETSINRIKKEIKQTKKESKEILSNIDFLLAKCNNLTLSVHNKKRELQRAKEVSSILRNSCTKANRKTQKSISNSLDVSKFISKICRKKAEIEEKRERISRKRASLSNYSSRKREMNFCPHSFNDSLSIEDLIWAIQSETYVWKSESTIFAKELLLNTWKHQLDLFKANTLM